MTDMGQGTEQGGAHGFVADGFEAVEREFQRNFEERGELGAAFAAVRDGELVVDLWGGVADREQGRAWTEDTLQLIFSGTKGIVAVCLLMLIDRGTLELDAPVARWWPEFAAAGKERVTVREVVAHTCRLPGVVLPVAVTDVPHDRLMAERLAAQAQHEDPRAVRTYHALTYGWLCGELVRRADGRSVGQFFAEEIARPLSLEVYIGLPEALEPRVSRLELAQSWGVTSLYEGAATHGDDLVRSVWGNPPLFSREAFVWNERAFHAAEIPGVNAIGTARAIARLYGSLDRLISDATLRRGRSVLERRREPLLDMPQAFGVGFALQTELRQLGRPRDAFGHGGAGGSVHGAWPSERVGFSYAMNLMRDDADADPRAQALLDALYDCVARSSGGAA